MIFSRLLTIINCESSETNTAMYDQNLTNPSMETRETQKSEIKLVREAIVNLASEIEKLKEQPKKSTELFNFNENMMKSLEYSNSCKKCCMCKDGESCQVALMNDILCSTRNNFQKVIAYFDNLKKNPFLFMDVGRRIEKLGQLVKCVQSENCVLCRLLSCKENENVLNFLISLFSTRNNGFMTGGNMMKMMLGNGVDTGGGMEKMMQMQMLSSMMGGKSNDMMKFMMLQQMLGDGGKNVNSLQLFN